MNTIYYRSIQKRKAIIEGKIRDKTATKTTNPAKDTNNENDESSDIFWMKVFNEFTLIKEIMVPDADTVNKQPGRQLMRLLKMTTL